MLRFRAISQKTQNPIILKSYATPSNVIKALKENNISLTRDVLIQSFEEMDCNGADGRNTSRGKSFKQRKLRKNRK